uniref:WAP domain-containing protein n=1 Tax=Panagrolaimus sp. JU765 TaxID=591449 RepID=A0AC34QHH4_9BILA
MDYCEYFNKLGIEKEECKPKNIEPPTIPPPAFGVCTVKFLFDTCQANDICESKKLCVQVTGEPCCYPPAHQCPTVEQLGVKCINNNPTNWCTRDEHCLRGRKCCPTGCGYNICV